MKRTLLALSVCAALAACNNTPKENAAQTSEAREESAATGDSVSVDLATSNVGWTGGHKGKVKPDRVGTFNLSSGTIYLKDGAVSGGHFVVDINSIKDLGQAPDTAAQHKLEGHLKSADFFDAAKYPTARFAITNIVPYDSTKAKSLLPGATNLVSGNLTFKDSTLNILFPAKIEVSGKNVRVEGKFVIDRTTWGLNYKGPNNPQDWFIDKEVYLTLNIKTK